MACPNYNSPEWKRLEKYVGGSHEAHKVFASHNKILPPIPSITELKKAFKFQSTIFTEKSRSKMQLLVGAYNKKNNTSHFIKFEKKTPGSESARLIMDFTPRSITNNIPNGSTKTTAKSGDTSVATTKDYDDIFKVGGNQYMAGGEIFASYEDAENYMAEHREKKNNAKLLSASKLKKNTVSGILTEIRNKSDWEYGKLLASKFAKYKSDTTIEVLDNEKFDSEYAQYLDLFGATGSPSGAAGVFLPGVNKILVRSSASEKTVLHEIAHALSFNILHSDKGSKSSKEFNEYFEKIKSILEKDGITKENYYGLTNSDEFIAEVFSDPNLVMLLKQYKATNPKNGRNLWEEFLSFFKRMFGASNDSMYEEALEKAIAVLDDSERMNHIFHVPSNYMPLNDQVKMNSDISKSLKTASDKILDKAKILSKSSYENSANISRMLKDLSNRLNLRVANKEYPIAILDFVNQVLTGELGFIIEEFQDNSGNLESGYINRAHDAAELYSEIANDIESILSDEGNPEYDEIRRVTNTSLANFSKTLHTIKLLADRETRKRSLAIVRDIMGDEFEGAPEHLLDKIETDISAFAVQFGSLRDVPDPIMQMIFGIIVRQHQATQIDTLNVGKDLLDAQLDMEKAGYKDMSIFHERYEGKRTGYFISEVNWGEYNIEKRRNKEKILKGLKKFGYDTFADVPEFKELSKEEKGIYTKIFSEFRDEYMIMEGNNHYTPNPPENKDYAKIRDTKVLNDYYSLAMATMGASRSMLPKAYSGSAHVRVMVPQIRTDSMEILKSKSDVFKKLKLRAKQSLIKSDQDTDYGMADHISSSGKVTKLVPIHYAMKLEDTDDLSDDITSMVVAFYEMAHKFNGFSSHMEEISLMQRALSDRTWTKGNSAGTFEDSNIAKMLNNFLDAQVFGKEEKDLEWKMPTTVNKMLGLKPDDKINMSKVSKNLLKRIREVNLFMNIPTSISGAAKGTFDLTLDAIAGKYISSDSIAWAEKESIKNTASVIENIGKRKKSGKLNLMLEFNGIYGDIDEQFDRMNQYDVASRMHSSDLTYSTYTVSDVKLKSQLSLAIYDNHRLVNEKFITLAEFKRTYGNKNSKKYDPKMKWSDYREKNLYYAYETVNGRFRPKAEFKKYIDKDLEIKIRYLIESRGAVITGQLTTYDRPEIARGIFGKFLMLHRNWMVAGIRERVKKTSTDPITHETEQGYYIAVATLMTRFVQEAGNLKQKLAVWNTLEDYEKSGVIKTLSDIGFSITVILLSNLMQGLADDEPDDYWIQYLAFQINRIRLEQVALMGVKEQLAILNSPTAAGSFIKTITSMGKLVSQWDEIEYGSYSGMYPIQKAIIKNSRLKNIWQLRNVESIRQSNKFLTTQMLN